MFEDSFDHIDIVDERDDAHVAAAVKGVLGLTDCSRFKWWWPCPGWSPHVMQNFLDDIWVSDFGNDTQGATAHWAYGNINVKHTFESLRPS
ncbi:MAG: hypothetical protein O7H40_13995 [Gammaproteobacteria bacterium]|nr:hypothetical protein [Gammaproteobacteria bacterium]